MSLNALCQHCDTLSLFKGVWDICDIEADDSVLTKAFLAKANSCLGTYEFFSDGKMIYGGVKTELSDSTCYGGLWFYQSGVLITKLLFTKDFYTTNRTIQFFDVNTFYQADKFLDNWWLIRIWRKRINPPSSQTTSPSLAPAPHHLAPSPKPQSSD